MHPTLQQGMTASELEEKINRTILLNEGQVQMPITPDAHWPSSASVQLNDRKIIGTCLRKLAYDWKLSGRMPSQANNQLKALAGKSMEKVIQNYLGQAGIAAGSNIRVRIFNLCINGKRGCDATDLSKPLNGISFLRWPISMEFDQFILSPDNTIAGGEIKCKGGRTFSSKVMQRIPGRRSTPIDDNLLQVMLYLHSVSIVKPLLNGSPCEVNAFYLIYIDRDTCARRIFRIFLDKDGFPIIEPSYESTYTDRRFTVHDILRRYALFETYLLKPFHGKEMEMPPREFELIYSIDKIKQMAFNTELKGDKRTKAVAIDPSKPKLNAQQKKVVEYNEKHPDTPKPILTSSKQPLGDFQCVYCSHIETCWGKDLSSQFTKSRQVEEDSDESKEDDE